MLSKSNRNQSTIFPLMRGKKIMFEDTIQACKLVFGDVTEGTDTSIKPSVRLVTTPSARCRLCPQFRLVSSFFGQWERGSTKL